jgi:aminoglycoside phosphotransferase (APT) family kinase protein
MRRVAGIAQGHRLVRGATAGLAAQCATEMARIHSITPPRPDLEFLGAPPADAHAAFIAAQRGVLDAAGTPRPVVEWGLRHLERTAPPPAGNVLNHNDFRTGNYMVADGRITAVLDWEFAAWGDPHEDLGWFTARCWRFGQNHLEAGGIGPMDAFLAGYAAEAGWQPDLGRVRFWQLGATIRWAVIAADQAARHLSGQEPSLELALTGHMVPELEWDVLNQAEALHAGKA